MMNELADRLEGWWLDSNPTPEREAIIKALRFAADMETLECGISIYPPNESCQQWRVNRVGSLDLIQANTLFEAVEKLK